MRGRGGHQLAPGCLRNGRCGSFGLSRVRSRAIGGSDSRLSRRARRPHFASWRYEPMADKGVVAGFMTRGPPISAPSGHAELLTGFRAKLAGRKSPLESVPADRLERARKEFRELPEVAGEPLPAPSRGR
jgi:hypothetical protein